MGSRQNRRDDFEVLDSMFEDLPDGAYFAAMAEHGFEPWEIAELAGEIDDAPDDDEGIE